MQDGIRDYCRSRYSDWSSKDIEYKCEQKDIIYVDKPERLNVRMGELATAFLDNPPDHLRPRDTPVIFPAQQVCIMQENQVLTADIPN